MTLRSLLLATILLLLQGPAKSAWHFVMDEDEGVWTVVMQENGSMSMVMPIDKPTTAPTEEPAPTTGKPSIGMGKGSKGTKGNKGSKGENLLPSAVVEALPSKGAKGNNGSNPVPATSNEKGGKGMTSNGGQAQPLAGIAGSAGVPSTMTKGSKGDGTLATKNAAPPNVVGGGIPQVRKASAVQTPDMTGSSGEGVKPFGDYDGDSNNWWLTEEVEHVS